MFCSPEDCKFCVRDLADKVFRLRVSGEKITTGNWCDEAKEIADVFERMFRKDLERRDYNDGSDSGSVAGGGHSTEAGDQ